MTPIPSEYVEISDMQRVFSRMGALLSDDGRVEYCRAVILSIYDLRMHQGSYYRPEKSHTTVHRVDLRIETERGYHIYRSDNSSTILSIYLSNNNEIYETFNGPASHYSNTDINNRIRSMEELEAIPAFERSQRVRRRKVNEARPYLNSASGVGHGSDEGNKNGGHNGNGGNNNNGGPGGNGNGNGNGGGNGVPGGGGLGGGDGNGPGGLVEVISHPVLFSISADDYAAILDLA